MSTAVTQDRHVAVPVRVTGEPHAGQLGAERFDTVRGVGCRLVDATAHPGTSGG